MIRRLDKLPFSRRELTLKIFSSTCCEILIYNCNEVSKLCCTFKLSVMNYFNVNQLPVPVAARSKA